ncbi:MAG: glutaredoxin family protein [Planctomycetes bacterium]|nr:glutaredoxin family protein [Planctomycetota bacterium]
MTRVEGDNKGNVALYALSTCGWCKKTKGLLDDMHAGYSYVYVDQLADSDRKEVLDKIKEWNPKCTFPTMVINDNTCIVGFKEEETREALASGA